MRKESIYATLAMSLASLSLFTCCSFAQAEPRVRLATSMGDIVIDLRPDVAPGHAQNFLNYVNDGDYDQSFIHRSVSGFVIQGGGFRYIDPDFYYVATDPAITNEPALSNVRGTVAMAKVGGDPDSATSQWFINLADNSANLDYQNEGFTVFGTVVLGMDVADAIAALPIRNLGAPIGGQVPLRNLPESDPIVWDDHLVKIESAMQESFAVPVLPWSFVALLAVLLSTTGIIMRRIR